jgi:hypothetical protein
MILFARLISLNQTNSKIKKLKNVISKNVYILSFSRQNKTFFAVHPIKFVIFFPL